MRLTWAWVDGATAINISVSPPRKLRDGSTEMRPAARYSLPPTLIRAPFAEKDLLVRAIMHTANMALAGRDE